MLALLHHPVFEPLRTRTLALRLPRKVGLPFPIGLISFHFLLPFE
jgi:hypothetical protein